MKSATVVPIDRSAGRNFPIAGMYSFHSSGEYCWTVLSAIPKSRQVVQAATASRRAARQ
jgi:hypothetical protein